MENPYEGPALGGQQENTENRVNTPVRSFHVDADVAVAVSNQFALFPVHNAGSAGEDSGQ